MTTKPVVNTTPSSAQTPEQEEMATWQSLKFENFNVRYVEYPANYRTDGWQKANRVFLCIHGYTVIEFADGRTHLLTKGNKLQVSEQHGLYRCWSKEGAQLVIVEGKFLFAQKTIQRNPWRM